MNQTPPVATTAPLPYTAGVNLPAIIDEAGDSARRRFIEFFTANIRNRNTRQSYARAVGQFLHWCEAYGLPLEAIEPIHVAAYIEQHLGSTATVKQHLAALRHLFDWMVTGQVIPSNPGTSVRGPKLVVSEGKTPILTAEEARALLDAPNVETLPCTACATGPSSG